MDELTNWPPIQLENWGDCLDYSRVKNRLIDNGDGTASFSKRSYPRIERGNGMSDQKPVQGCSCQQCTKLKENVFVRVDKLREENNMHWDSYVTDLGRIYEDLYRLRYGGAMADGQDLRTNLICVTNSLLDLMSYLRKRDESK